MSTKSLKLLKVIIKCSTVRTLITKQVIFIRFVEWFLQVLADTNKSESGYKGVYWVLQKFL